MDKQLLGFSANINGKILQYSSFSSKAPLVYFIEPCGNAQLHPQLHHEIWFVKLDIR